jgi:hypothetical protein
MRKLGVVLLFLLTASDPAAAWESARDNKTPEVLRAMGLDALEKSERALDELRAKGVTA